MKQGAGTLQEDSLLMGTSALCVCWSWALEESCLSIEGTQTVLSLVNVQIDFLSQRILQSLSPICTQRPWGNFPGGTICQKAGHTVSSEKQEKLAKWVEKSPKTSRSWVRNLRVSSWQRRKIPRSSWELGEGTAKLLRCFILFWKVQISTLSPITVLKKNKISQKYEQRPQENWEITNMKTTDLLDWVWEVFL